jgi:secretion/DNA translocation related TadE-like protein
MTLPPHRLAPREQGFVTVAMVGLMLVLVVVSALVATLGAVAVARHRAAAVADLAALAAASHALEGSTAACGRARQVAQAQRARLETCALDGLDVLVEVSVRPPGPLGGYGQARAASRAGPKE